MGFSPWLPGPVDLIQAQHRADAQGTRNPAMGALLFLLAFPAFALTAQRAELLPFAPLVGLPLVAHLGAPPGARDALGTLIPVLILAGASMALAVGARGTLLVAAVGYYLLSTLLATVTELPFRIARNQRWLRFHIARALACLSALAAAGALVFGVGRSPHWSWIVAPLLGCAAAVFELRASSRAFRAVSRPDEWLAGTLSDDGRIVSLTGAPIPTAMPTSALPPGPVVIIPQSPVAHAPYRAADAPLDPLVLPGTPDELRIAIWDVQTCRWSLAAAIVAATSAPLLGAAIASQ